MVKQYLQQVWQLFRQQPVVAWITVAGTALSIFLIMLVVMGVTTYPVNLPGQSSVAVDVRATGNTMAWRLGAALVPVRYCDYHEAAYCHTTVINIDFLRHQPTSVLPPHSRGDVPPCDHYPAGLRHGLPAGTEAHMWSGPASSSASASPLPVWS